MKNGIILFLVLISNLCIANKKDIPEITIVKEKLFEFAMNKVARDEDFSLLQTKKILALLDEKGDFSDIDYLNIEKGAFQPGEHWMRLYKLSLLYQTKGEFFHDKALAQKIINSVRFWIHTDPIITSTWWNNMGVPLCIGKVFILMENELPKDIITDGIAMINRGVRKDHYEYYGPATGQNLLWIAFAHVYSSCFANDTAGLHRAFNSAEKEIKISTDEGIQPDYSFHQHGPQFYSFGYGKTFSLTAAQLIYLAQNTRYQFSDEKIAILSHYILDGQQWATRNKFLEYTAKGREISRNVPDTNSLLFAIKIMSGIDKDRKLEYQIFYDQLKSGYRDVSLIGNRYFRYSDFMVQQRKGYYFSVKGASKKIIASESGNGENIKGYYQGNGTYYLTKTGKEYDGIFPLLNWKQLPGSLAEQDSASLPLIDFGRTNFGHTNFVYGVSDSLYGAFGYDYKKDKVQAKRSWFMFDKEIVCLVAGVNYSSTNKLCQTLNQCYANGDIWVNNKKFDQNQLESKKIKRVYHDSVGYVFDSTSFLKKVTVEKRTGSWNDINKMESKQPFSKKVFSLNIDLGKQLENQHFMYAILPNISGDSFRGYNLKKHISILKNDSDIQAVFQKDLKQVQAVFYTAGSLKLPWDNKWIKINKPGLIMVEKINNQLVIHLNPQLDNMVYHINSNVGFSSPNKVFELVKRP
nr:polysaccharide lyase family 8 super-sandwich domain-containing protein [uncultured Pedobacter sp.]